jgi:hypothetical protein
MYRIKGHYLEQLLIRSHNGYPDRKVIKAYMNGRMAQENSVRAFAAFLRVGNWRTLVS